MNARDKLFDDIWDMRSAAEKNALIDAYRDEVALEIGRDALRDGLIPTLTRLVGDANAAKMMADFRDAYARELAEKIRERARRIEEVGASATGRHAEETATRRRAWDTAADLIDPQAPDA